MKIKELQVLDTAQKRFLKYQQEQQKTELRRLDDEIDRKVCVILFSLFVWNQWVNNDLYGALDLQHLLVISL